MCRSQTLRVGVAVATVLCLVGWGRGQPQDAPVTELDIAAGIIESLDRGQLTREQLLHYFESNGTLLRRNIAQAKAKHQEDDLDVLIASALPRYVDGRAEILSSHRRFAEVRGPVIERIREAYGDEIPQVVLVPCLGLYSAMGWADQIEGTHHIFIALERLSDDTPLDAILTHEIVHGISEIDGSTVAGGFYDEGHATYVSSKLCPGRPEEAYFPDMDEERYERYLAWIDANRKRILEDSAKPFVVLDDVHKLYFTTSFTDVPNIAYVIGFKYVEHLAQKYTLKELRTFGMNASENRKEFEEFIRQGTFARSGTVEQDLAGRAAGGRGSPGVSQSFRGPRSRPWPEESAIAAPGSVRTSTVDSSSRVSSVLLLRTQPSC